jgi:hypothetical protein
MTARRHVAAPASISIPRASNSTERNDDGRADGPGPRQRPRDPGRSWAPHLHAGHVLTPPRVRPSPPHARRRTRRHARHSAPDLRRASLQAYATVTLQGLRSRRLWYMAVRTRRHQTYDPLRRSARVDRPTDRDIMISKSSQARKRLNARRKEKELCIRCGLPRGDDGTPTFCRLCADIKTARVAASRRKPSSTPR